MSLLHFAHSCLWPWLSKWPQTVHQALLLPHAPLYPKLLWLLFNSENTYPFKYVDLGRQPDWDIDKAFPYTVLSTHIALSLFQGKAILALLSPLKCQLLIQSSLSPHPRTLYPSPILYCPPVYFIALLPLFNCLFTCLLLISFSIC